MKDDSEKQGRWNRFKRLKTPKGAIKRRARKVEIASLKHAHRFIVRRWTNLREVSRDASAWLVAVGLLIVLALFQSLWLTGAYTTQAPADGGTYAEGVTGRLETINPLFASTPAELSASKLVFSSLLSYDRDNRLRSDVATSWNISGDGKIYTIYLKNNVYWHDGVKLSADDVIFTINCMQNPSVKAVTYGNWAGVKAEKVNDTTVKITLPSVFGPFEQSLTFGIIPEHVLKNVAPADLRESDFGRKPVGTGPFVFKKLQVMDAGKDRLVVHFEENNRYYGEQPKLKRFQLYTYEDRDSLQRALVTNEVNAALGLGADQLHSVETKNGLTVADNKISDGMFALFNNDSPTMKDAQVRQALLLATNRLKVIAAVYGRGSLMEGPLPKELVSGEQAVQAAYNLKEASAKLDAAGWKVNGLERQKDGKNLELALIAPDSGDYKLIVNELSAQWRLLGVTVKVQLVDPKTIAADYLQGRSYDVLVYELSVGGDPDVYAYWHSSQANQAGLNFANYRSGLVDDALLSARARLDPALRQAKYKKFYEQWVRDVPAIALYQPYISYATMQTTTSFEPGQTVVDATTRYRDVTRWAVSETSVMTTR